MKTNDDFEILGRNDREIFARNMRVRRMYLHLSQEQLAKKAHLSPGQISRIERGAVFPRWSSADAIAAALKVETGQLFGDGGDDSDGGRLIESYPSLRMGAYREWLATNKTPVCGS